LRTSPGRSASASFDAVRAAWGDVAQTSEIVVVALQAVKFRKKAVSCQLSAVSKIAAWLKTDS